MSAVYVDMYMSTAVHYLFISAFSVTLYENVFNVDKALTSAYHLLLQVDQKCVSSYMLDTCSLFQPPIVPKLSHDGDTSNFESYEEGDWRKTPPASEKEIEQFLDF